MTKKINLISILLLALFLALPVLTGCRSDGYYEEQAVERARRFLLKEKPEMPLAEQEYIKFNRPFFLVLPMSENRGTGLSEICISWMVPDNPDVYMVFGVSGYRMIDWTPERIICKNFDEPREPYRQAAGAASDFITQNLYGLLSSKSLNHLRYTMPGVWKCTFPLDSNPEIDLDEEELAQASKLPRYVMAWEIEENGEKRFVVRVGTASDDTLKGFNPYFAAILSEADFYAGLPDAKPLIEPFGGNWDKLMEELEAPAQPAAPKKAVQK